MPPLGEGRFSGPWFRKHETRWSDMYIFWRRVLRCRFINLDIKNMPFHFLTYRHVLPAIPESRSFVLRVCGNRTLCIQGFYLNCLRCVRIFCWFQHALIKQDKLLNSENLVSHTMFAYFKMLKYVVFSEIYIIHSRDIPEYVE